MLDRRGFLAGIASILAAPLAVEAQPSEKVRRIAFLSGPTPAPENVDTFRQGLRENGYVEGRNLHIEWRSAEGEEERLPGLVTELKKLKVEVMVTEGPS